MKLRYMNTVKKGFSMIELIIVIAVLGVLTAVVLNQAQGMRESSNLNRESSNLGMLTTAIQSTFNSQGNYSGLTDEVIMSSTSFPSAMQGGDIKTVWDNDGVEVGPATYNGQPSAGFVMIYRNVPQSACMDFISQNYSSFFGVQVANTTGSSIAIPVNGSTVINSGNAVYSTDPSGAVPYLVSKAQEDCSSGSGGKDISFFSR